jgi:drug/metabolite transporter (DMT)-like permease
MSLSAFAAVSFALVAALLYAAASVLQQQQAATQPAEAAMRPGLLVRLVQNRRWLLGLACDGVGYGAEAVALGFGTIVVVAPLLQTGLLFALFFGARLSHRALRRRDWTAVVVLTVGLALFLLVARPEGGISRPSFAAWWPWLASLTIATTGSLVIGWRARGATRAVTWGLAAALCYGITGPLTKTAVDLLSHGEYATLAASWELYLLIGAAALGMLFNQSAFQAGNLPASLPVIAIGTPVFGCLIGIVAYNEHLTTSGAFEYTVLVASIVAMVAGILFLARGEAGRDAVQSPPTLSTTS